MNIKNMSPHISNQNQRSFMQWKRAILMLFGVLCCCLIALHIQQAWSAYCCYQQGMQYNKTEQQYDSMHNTLQRITTQHAVDKKQLQAIQTQCTPPVNPAGIFALDNHIPNMTLHSAHIAPDLVALDLTIAASALSQLDTQLRTLFCSVPVVQSIKNPDYATDTPLLTLAIHIKPTPVCPTSTINTDSI